MTQAGKVGICFSPLVPQPLQTVASLHPRLPFQEGRSSCCGFRINQRLPAGLRPSGPSPLARKSVPEMGAESATESKEARGTADGSPGASVKPPAPQGAGNPGQVPPHPQACFLPVRWKARPNHVHLSASSLLVVINISTDHMSQRNLNRMKLMKPERFGIGTHTVHTPWDHSPIKNRLKRGPTQQRPARIV